MSNIQIEVAKTSDKAAIYNLRRLFGQLYPNWSQSQIESRINSQTLAELLESPADTLLLVKSPEDHIIGTATLNLVYQVNGRVAQIEGFVIDQDWRRRGLGGLLLDKLLDLAAEQQAWIVELVSERRRRDSHRLYEAAGFCQRDSFYYSLRLSGD